MNTKNFLVLSFLSGCILANAAIGQAPIPSAMIPGLSPPPQPVDTNTRFDLDFPGGTPAQLVKAIEKDLQQTNKSTRHLNVYIDEEYQDFRLPPLKMHNVTVPQLFQALSQIGKKQKSVVTRYVPDQYGKHAEYTSFSTSFGFRTHEDRPTENSIWHFYQDGVPDKPLFQELPPQVRYWNLSGYLENLKVEDITTAIETGWKMQGANPVPKLSFHKDTKLLIAVGEELQLAAVNQVLQSLQSEFKEPTPGRARPARGLPVLPTQ